MTQKLHTVLGANGKATGKVPTIPKNQLIHWYKTMVLTRTLDVRSLKLQRAGRIGFYVSCLGEEALAIGAAAALKDTDWIFPTYRMPGMALYHGDVLTHIMNLNFGNGEDLTKGRQMPVHYSFSNPHFVSISSPIGTQISQAVGTAMAMKYRKEKGVTLACMGDGGTSSNDFHAGMNFAGVYKSPCIFLCENNQWAISVPVEKQTASKTIAIKGEAYGMPWTRVDGNDVFAVYQAVKDAADRARKGQGPTFIEAVTFRMGSHSSSDDWTKYRSKKDVAEWEKKDPISRFEKFLKEKGIWTKKFADETAAWADAECTKAIRSAEAASPPAISSMFEDVYAEIPPHLADQYQEMKALVESGMKGDEEEGAFPL